MATPHDLTYSVTNVLRLSPMKVSLDVRLNRRATETELRSVAIELRDKEAAGAEQIFIVYYLPEMKVDSGGWATTHFRPDLDVRILGLTLEQFDALTQPENADDRELIGRWLDDTPLAGRRISIFRADQQVCAEQTFSDLSSIREELDEEQSGDIQRFKKRSAPGVFYTINNDGHLEIHDREGLITLLPQI
jgi:hypothetical protein